MEHISSINRTDDDYWTKNRHVINRILWWYVLWASLIGVAFNVFCLWKMTRLKLSQKHRALFSIALANLLTLILILIPHATSSSYYLSIDYRFLTKIYCKAYTFLLHSSAMFATWCWLLLAMIRFAAVYSPFTHFRYRYCNIWLAVVLLVITCCLWETWTLVVITDPIDNNRSIDCSIDADLISIDNFRNLNVAEIVFTYFVPFALIVAADVSVFCRIYLIKPRAFRRIIVENCKTPADNSPSNFSYCSGNNDENRAMVIVPRGYVRKLSRQRRRVFVRLISLTFLNLFLNLPNCVIRLLNTFDGSGWWLPHPYNDMAQKISYALGYTHYALSYVYLEVLIRSTKSGSKVTRHRRPPPAEFDHLLLQMPKS